MGIKGAQLLRLFFAWMGWVWVTGVCNSIFDFIDWYKGPSQSGNRCGRQWGQTCRGDVYNPSSKVSWLLNINHYSCFVWYHAWYTDITIKFMSESPKVIHKLTNMFKFTIPPHLHKLIVPDGNDTRTVSREELNEIYQIFFPNDTSTPPVNRKDSVARYQHFVLPCLRACVIWRPDLNLLCYFESVERVVRTHTSGKQFFLNTP